MKKGKRLVAVLLLTLLLVTLAACGGGTAGGAASGGGASSGGTGAAEPIKIGHEVALTGGSALWGQAEKNALDMAIEKINADGGVLGRPLQLIAYDNKAEQAEGVNVANRLVNDGVIAVIGPAQSGVAIAAAAVFEEAGVIAIGTTTTNEKLTVPEGQDEALRYIFRSCFIDPYQGDVAATFALQDLGVTKAGILKDVGSDYSTYLAMYFSETFTGGGGTIVADESFRTDELEYKAQLSKIKDAGAEVLFIPTMQKEAGLAMKQAKELGMDCYFLGGDAWASDELVELGGDATEGGFFVNIASLADPVLKDWVDEYTAKWGRAPVMPNPPLAVDGLYAVVAAIEATGTTDTAILADWIANCKDVQVLTGKLTMDPQTHNPLGKPAVIETVQNGEFVFYKGIAAAID
ncbi:MAG: ABC transporter substrate-binding protein [Peptococcaceae bacterium]|jgi:branched-chain amino acid transport system substrate-binding protein|nr:ABC transporter substrate-binding protein [Peptococcaceae bacterium]